MRRRTVLAVPAALAALAASACTSDDPAATPSASPQEVLAQVHDVLVAGGGLTIALSSSAVPTNVNGVTAAAGQGVVDPDEPKFKGTVTGTIRGVAGTINVITIGDSAWMKLFTPDYAPVSLTDLGAPNPSDLFDPKTGIAHLVVATRDPQAGKPRRQGKEILKTYTGTLPGEPVRTLLNLGAGTGDFQVEYGVADGHQLRATTITGAFYPGATSTYTLTLTDFGSTVAISAP
ncbi:MAG: LppX_LprAFG lipoprotein [Nostocoides sp.]